MEKTCIILRATPGAGKSTVADYIKNNNKYEEHTSICCADDYFTDNLGSYNWDATKIGLAHIYCKNKFMSSLNDKSSIIVSNTNINTSDVNWYRSRAIEAGYKVFVMTVENWHDGNDIHNVPVDVKDRMKYTLLNSIKLGEFDIPNELEIIKAKGKYALIDGFNSIEEGCNVINLNGEYISKCSKDDCGTLGYITKDASAFIYYRKEVHRKFIKYLSKEDLKLIKYNTK